MTSYFDINDTLVIFLGHIHLTDFNIATYVPEGKIAISLSGTRPYLAPEVFMSSIGKLPGYSFEADWWSWGITLCELVRGKVSCIFYFIYIYIYIFFALDLIKKFARISK